MPTEESNRFKAGDIDPILASVLARRLKAITEEMGIALLRTTRSPILNEARDFVTGLYDAQGRMLEQTEYIPVLAFALQPVCAHIMEYFAGDIHEGDVILHNDVFSGGNQNNDVAAFRPIFHQGRLFAWAAVKGHQADIGGAVAGGYNPAAREVWQEAFRIPPVKVFEKGKRRRDVWELIFANVRLKTVEADMEAQIGATRVGERGLHALLARHGQARLEAHLEYLMAATERMVRAEIAAIPDGTYRGRSYAYYDGVNDGSRMRIELAVSVEGDGITFDFSGSAEQTEGFVNAPRAATESAVLLTFLMLIDPAIPHNDGLTRPLCMIIPEGSFLNARFPAATTFGNSLAGPTSDAIFQAFSGVLADRVTAGWNRMLGCVLTGTEEGAAASGGASGGKAMGGGERFVDILFLALKGGSGAMLGCDGYDHIGLINCAGGILAQDYEMFEKHNPVTLKKHEFARDSAGPGQWRGGLGVETEFVIHAGGVTAIVFGDGVEEEARAFGLFGGGAGSLNHLRLTRPNGSTPGGSSHVPRAKEIIEDIPPGTVYAQTAGGGGGYGDPHLRPALRVAAEVADGVLSVTAARRDYGVIMDRPGRGLDAAATKSLRQRKEKS